MQKATGADTESAFKAFYLPAEEVMFSLCLYVCLFVCLLAGLRKNYSVDFHIIPWNGGTWAAEDIVRFWW